jgi:hypothetical protein
MPPCQPGDRYRPGGTDPGDRRSLHAAHDAIGPVTALALDVAFPALLLVIVGTAKRAV